jgi:hypothetical protein
MEQGQSNWPAVHIHLLGVVKLVEHLKCAGGKMKGLSHYSMQVLAYSDALTGLLGYGIAVPDDLVPGEKSWVERFARDADTERWMLTDFKHVEFLRMIARFKFWAEGIRKAGGEEMDIVDWGDQITSTLEDWREHNILPYGEDEGQEPQFLWYPRLQFISRRHAEMHLLWCALLLMTSFIAFPTPGPHGPARTRTAVDFCNIFAYLEDGRGSVGTEARTFGQFFARLTFEQGPFIAGSVDEM